MMYLGTLDQQQLSVILRRIGNLQKTGKIVLERENIREEVYLHQGKVIAVISARSRKPLVGRLVAAGVISVNALQKVPNSIGMVISQAQGAGCYSDVQVAKIVIKLGLIDQEQLAAWFKQETMEALRQLFDGVESKIYFEQGAQPPDDCLCVLFRANAPSYANARPEEGRRDPVTPLPAVFKTSEPVTKPKQFVPVMPSSFAQLPEMVFSARERIQRTITAILPKSFSDDITTLEIATPSLPNPLFTWETFLILALLLVAGLAHGINMFHFPYYEDDEGTYLSQAWAVLHLGHLTYYTYWYDHAPAGWIQIALWTAITGIFHPLGSAMDYGRILMLLFQLGSTFVLYRIARTISGSMAVATIVVLLFALSPYGLYYHRRILLDNIMTFWMLLSILCLFASRLSLKHVWLSAISLAISALSKEVTIFIIPAVACLVWVRANKLHRSIALIGWLVLVITIISAYPCFAFIKGELFPTGTLMGGDGTHVSLIGTVLYQSARGKDGGLFNMQSLFWHAASVWAHDDPLLVIGGSVCAILSVFFIKKQRSIGMIGLITLSLWMFIARGGIVLDFYFIPLLPLSALSLGLMLGVVANYLKPVLKSLLRRIVLLDRILYSIFVVILIYFIVMLILPSLGIGYGASNVGSKDDPFIEWDGTQAVAQREAVTWIEGHVHINNRIIIDMYMWPDLYSKGYMYAHYYSKLENDPAIRTDVFHNDWRNVDYIVTTPQMLLDMQSSHMELVKALIENSTTVVAFDTGQWRIDIRKVHK